MESSSKHISPDLLRGVMDILLYISFRKGRLVEMSSPRYMELLKQMEDLHVRKSAGYAGDNPDAWANFRMCEAFGVSSFVGCLIRLGDKYIRITNLVKNPKNEKVGESIKDTLFDLASYALIAICLLEEKE